LLHEISAGDERDGEEGQTDKKGGEREGVDPREAWIVSALRGRIDRRKYRRQSEWIGVGSGFLLRLLQRSMGV